jgi:hypothetical protein
LTEKEKPFEVAKQRTPKGAAETRRREMIDKMAELLAIVDKEVVIERIKTAFNITPESPQFAAIMNVWRSGHS